MDAIHGTMVSGDTPFPIPCTFLAHRVAGSETESPLSISRVPMHTQGLFRSYIASLQAVQAAASLLPDTTASTFPLASYSECGAVP